MRYLSTLVFFFFILSVSAQNLVLHFNDKGSFKIIQFTDIHYQKNNPESAVAISLIREVLIEEKPDLVVFTGDVIYSKPVKEGLDEVFNEVEQSEIPWAYVFGNHDDEHGMSRQELMDYVMTKTYCIAQPGNKALKGVGNYILEVKSKDGNENKALLYFFDSGAYTPIKGLGTYDWFAPNQIEWYKNQSAAYTIENDGVPYPALAFFHIPLVEYAQMKAEKYNELIGSKDEKECNGKLNTGMFAAMRQAGDVMGTFVGHDHDNDYIGNYYDIYLAYGRFSGGNTEYNNLGKNGCRVIELKEGQRVFSTYIRLLGGEKLYPVEYPKTFSKK
ncbi:metallophosphoesterase family protein [Dysgonomonas sp. Marseille-P4677]|uniref:metallophosphoesterase family protein n=1 Tax=Dysgonomonas sp. Marseille-P4677 TaxID=2364790 RepID=UPI001912E3C9|nr:metallophosphoesterase family protein [Dysgonomonas sp. Marseille-P4677]MBK5720434.1 metallophosphoesterase family protein [Dysgonomonas sp. Marseille-P4677]